MWHRVDWYIREIGFDILAVCGVMLRLYHTAPPGPHKMKSDRIVAFGNCTLRCDPASIASVRCCCYSVHTVWCREREMCVCVWDRNDLQEGHCYVTARIVTPPAGQYCHALLFCRKVALLVNSVRTCLIVGREGSHLKE